jgi:hypothetical protein
MRFAVGIIQIALSTILTGLVCLPSQAAVRRCGAVVSSEIVTAGNEQTAKRQALEQWAAKARMLGRGFDSWRLAIDRALKCFPAQSGNGFQCMAVGSPCIIQNNPHQQPSGPDGKGVGL